MDKDLERIMRGEDVSDLLRRLDGTFRTAGLVLMYFASLMTFGLVFWKAVLVTFVVWLMMRFGFARRQLERLGILVFGLVVVYWSGLLPLDAWARGLIAITSRALV